MIRLFSIFFFFCVVSISIAQGQDSPTNEKDPLLTGLNQVLEQIRTEERALDELQEKLRSKKSEGLEGEITEQIKKKSETLDELQRTFRELSSGVDTANVNTPEEQSRSFEADLKSLIDPLVAEVQQLTKRPRAISRLKKELEKEKEQKTLIENAVTKVSSTIEASESEILKKELEAQKQWWQKELSAVETRLTVLKQRLAQYDAEKKTITEAITESVKDFFATRGKNLLIAFLIAITFWLLLRKVRHQLQSAHESSTGKFKRYYRAIQVLLLPLSVIGTLLIFSLSLYLLHDWVLLVLSILILVGLLWTVKEAIPRYAQELTFLMNFGTVREGERVEIDGISYCVTTLNFHTILENPILEGSIRRIPLSDLPQYRSRPFNESELWFPTMKQDWVLLDDGTYGQVMSQTPLVVDIQVPGNALKRYTTAAFISNNPQVISGGFRIVQLFGLTYDLQSSITAKIPSLFAQRLQSALEAENIKDEISQVTCRFAEAAASSLNLKVIVMCTPSAAPQYLLIQDLIQRICVEICNEEQYEIPFNQLTVHMDKTV